MHWLLSLDTALFHFVNRSLANRFFDGLMPVLSGDGVPWLWAVILAVPAGLLFGSVRLKICALLMVLVVALGDPLVVGTLKDAVARPRPFVTLKDARLFGVVGKGYVRPQADGALPPSANRHSFPSAHAANTFAVAMVGFLFYRRSAWFLFPLAAAIAFSRVYNGVHYPIDITVGALLGLGYGWALVWLLQKCWDVIGQRVFPAWHAQLPGLRNAGRPAPGTPVKSPAAAPAADQEWLRLGYLFIALTLVGHWIYVASGIIGLSEDEAYQWLWSKHLALSYYSKAPGIAYIQWVGTSLFGDNNFGVRFFSPVFAAILSTLMLRFIGREAGVRTAFLLLLVTYATPLLVVGSVLMTVDPPMVLCWMWGVLAGWRALQPASTTRDWLRVGVALGLGFLCKYTAMLQIVCWALFFLLHPAARGQLKKAGPKLALLVFFLGTLPVLIWNARHHWITVFHVLGDAGMSEVGRTSHEHHTLLESVVKSLNYFVEFTAGEFGVLNPIFFLGALWAAVAAWKRRAEKPLWCFLFCMGVPVFVGHWLFSFHSRVQLNWPAASVPPLFCLMALYWSDRWRAGSQRIRRWLTAGILLGIAASIFIHDPGLIGRLAGHKLPGDVDPAHVHFARGGRETARVVEAERAGFDPAAFIIADHYGTTGLYSFYSPPARAAAGTAKQTKRPLVYCINTGEIIDQFAYWDDYDYRQHRLGENALFVQHLPPYKLEPGWIWKWLRGEQPAFRSLPEPQAVPGIASQFQSVTNLGVREIQLDDGRVFQRVQLFGCYHLNPKAVK